MNESTRMYNTFRLVFWFIETFLMDNWIIVAILYFITFGLIGYVCYAHYEAYERTKKFYKYTFINNSHKHILLPGDGEVKTKSQATYLFDDLDKPKCIATIKSGEVKWDDTYNYLNFDEVIVQVDHQPYDVNANITPVIITIASDTYWNIRIDTSNYDKEIAVITCNGDTLKNPTNTVSCVCDILTPECNSINYRECASGRTNDEVAYTVTRLSFNEVKITLTSY